MQALTVRVDDKLHEALRAHAFEQKQTMGTIVRVSLKMYLQTMAGYEEADDASRSR